MNKSEVVTALDAFCAQFDTQKEAALKLGVSPQYVTDVLRGRREPGGKILKKLKFKRVVTYEAVK